MNQIARLLSSDNVVADLDVSSKKRLFEQLGRLLENQQDLTSSQVFDALFSRERLGSTGLGFGVAIPHGRIKGLQQAVGAFVRLLTPVEFNAPDGRPVDLIFALLVPEVATEQHLQLLSELAQMFSEPAVREKRAASPDVGLATRVVFASWQPG
jgi:PTS system nitrogen regulatory IIA component